MITAETVVWDLGLLGAGESGRRKVIVSINDTVDEGDVLQVNSVLIEGYIGSVLTQSRASETTRVEDANMLGFGVNISTRQSIPGEFVQVHLTVTNKKSTPMTAVKILQFFPIGFGVGIPLDRISDGGTCESICVVGKNIQWNVGTLGPGGGKTVTFDVTTSTDPLVLNGNLIPLMSKAFADNTRVVWARNTIIVDSTRKLSLFVDLDQEPVIFGPDLNYQLTFGNRGDVVATGMELRFPLPDNTIFVSASDAGALVGDEVVWNIGALSSGEGSLRNVIIRMNSGFIAGDIIEVHQATISADNMERTWASSVQRIKTNNNLDLRFMLNPQNATTGETFDIDITLDNMSAFTMTGVGLEMCYPQYLQDLSDSLISDSGNCTDVVSRTSECNSSETVIWNLPNMGSGDSNMMSLSPVVSMPSNGTVIQFFAKGKNSALDRSFITRSMLIGNFIAAAQPEIDIQGNGLSIFSGDATPTVSDNTAFGSVSINSTTQSETFVIRNVGNLDLNLIGNPRVSITGANASDFVVTTQPAGSIAMGDTSNFTIRFEPSALGSHVATVNINNDDADENPYTFQIQGLGTDTIPTPADVDAGDRFGESVAIDGNLIVAGAPMDEGGGAVYPFHLVDNEAIPEARLILPSGFTGSLFGASVALDGDLLFVGAPGVALTEDPHIQGAIYERVADSWVLLQTLAGTMDNGEGQFGASGAFDGDLLVVGAPLDSEGEGSGSGAIYLFERTVNVFLQKGKVKLQNPDAGARFGAAVGISNGRVAVGAPERVVNQVTSGEVTVYEIDQGELVERLKTTGSQSGAAARFGAALGIRNDVMVVGAPGEELDRGTSYVYFIGATLDERARLLGGGTSAGDGFGTSLSFDGESLVIGAPGFSAAGKSGAAAKGTVSSGAIFHYSGINFAGESLIDPLAGLQQLGAAVAVQGDDIVIGAPMTDDDQGAVALLQHTILIFNNGFEN